MSNQKGIHMLKKIVTGAVCGGALAAGVAVAAIAATNASKDALNEATYAPMQSISYLVGSKSAIGYFVQEQGACHVVLMVAENIDLDQATPPSAARLRLALRPGQGAGLDSDEGRSIDLTCGSGAATLTVREGRSEDLAVLTD
jgi:hypothetical protein